jgi:quinol monooxygenase YgiN
VAVFSIWESRFPTGAVAEGRQVTEAIWQDMQSCAGYLRHAIVEDLDEPGHLIVISEWESRRAADQVLVDYADNANATRANALVAEPRRRIVGQLIGGPQR